MFNLICSTFKHLIFRPTWQSLDLQIGTDGINVVTRDRRTIELSFQEKEIEDIIMWQVNMLFKNPSASNKDHSKGRIQGTTLVCLCVKTKF